MGKRSRRKRGGTRKSARAQVGRPIQSVGFPQFWETAHAVNPRAFKAFGDLRDLGNKLFLRPVSEPLYKVVRHIAKAVVNSSGALTTLVLNGYGSGAMLIARSMFEGALNAEYLRRHPDLIDDYLEFDFIRRKKDLDLLKEIHPEQEIPEAKRLEIEENYARVADRFKNSKGKDRRKWIKLSVYDLAKELGLLEHYQTFYQWASDLQHFSVRGLTSMSDGSSLDVDPAPSLLWLETALITGHDAALRVLYSYNALAGHGMDQMIQAAMAAYSSIWADPDGEGTQ